MRKAEIIKTLTCRICNSQDLYQFLDLGDIPIPNGFLNKEEIKKKEKRYPLSVVLCNNCFLVQLKYIVNPSIMFKNYLYIPSSSQTRLNHFRELAIGAKKLMHLDQKSLVVDIGSNDGSLLKCFQNLEIKVLGVDPAENLVKVAMLNGIDTVKGYFNPTIAKKIITKYKKASVILATNVVAHINNLHELMSGIDALLDDNGIFISQFPYLLDLINQNQFDTIYHEHLSYFSVKPLLELANSSYMEIFNIERNDLDGGSIRVFWKKKKNKKILINKIHINDILKLEQNSELYNKETYDKFTKRVTKLKHTVKKELLKLKKEKNHIAGCGAAAKGNILLNYFDIGPEIVDYIVDSTPYKQGLFTPGTHVPIFEEAKIYETNPNYILILAWNFKEEIMKKNFKYKKAGGKFIICIPQFEII